MKLILYYCYAIFHSVIDDITGPVCGETTGHLWIPVARDYWSGALVVQCAAIPSPLDSPNKRSTFVFFHVCLNELFNKQYTCKWVQIQWLICDIIIMCHLPIRHSTWLNIRMITSQLYWKSNRTYLIQNAPIRPVRWTNHKWPWLRKVYFEHAWGIAVPTTDKL